MPFENTDDDYHDRAASYYDMWADIGDHLTDFGRGLWDAVKDLGDGFLTLGVFIIPGMPIMYDAGILPEWMEERAEGVWKTRDVLLSDPWNTLGAIVQGAMDTVDEEGLTYGISYVATDVAIEILAEKGLGKLAEGSKGAKNATGLLDDVAGKMDVPSIGTAEGAGGTAAIGESAALGIGAVDEILESGSKNRIFRDAVQQDKELITSIKNYSIENASGRNNFVRNIENQYYQRIENLPEGTNQSVMIDIREQNVSDADLSVLYDGIMRRTDNGIEILFKMD